MALRIDPSMVSTPARESTAPADALDFKQFAALRRNADDPKALREVARQFESVFTKMMLESMRSASFGDPLFGSDQSDMYRDMFDDQMAVQLTQGRGIGLADMLIRQLGQGGQGAQASAGGNESDANESAGKVAPGQSRPVIDDSQRKEFIQQMLPHAEAAARELGVDPRAVIAQAALETGWGSSRPADASGGSNNFFGIKAGANWRGASVTAGTTEFVAGVAGSERARFRAYGSVAENVSDYVHLLRDNPRYAAALDTGSDVRAFATALQRGGYATDPRYADKLVAVAEQLDQINVKYFKPDVSAPIQSERTVEGNG
jgi:flagellar protein FlgJ